MHQGKGPSKFSKPQAVGGQSRTEFCSCKKRDPLLKLVAWHLKLHFLCKDAHETLSLASSLSLGKQGSSPVQEARPREMWLYPSMACHIYSARIITDTPNIKPFSPPVYISSQFLSSSIQTKVGTGWRDKIFSPLRIWAKSGIQLRAMIWNHTTRAEKKSPKQRI